MSRSSNIGVWLIGANGSVASTVVIGVLALARRLIEPVGLVTETNVLKNHGFIPFDNLVFGGHEIRHSSFAFSIREMERNGVKIPRQLVKPLLPLLKRIDHNIKPGIAFGSSKKGEALPDLVKRLINDITAFKKRHSLKEVIVVNLASTEPPVPEGAHTKTLAALESAINNNRQDLLQPSVLYAYASFKSGGAYINFTPSAGASIPGLRQMAEKAHLPHCGSDGKTGETLVKSALAPLFNYRALKVLSWQGYNILGNQDGQALSNPAVCKSKIMSKDGILAPILGYQPHSHIGIDFVPSLGDWKTAWDFIHFEGFLNTKMSMQFVWQGCDSILAAPLVIDLIRLVYLSRQRKEYGELSHLALFFKKPLGTNAADLHSQWQLFNNHLNRRHRKNSYAPR